MKYYWKLSEKNKQNHWHIEIDYFSKFKKKNIKGDGRRGIADGVNGYGGGSRQSLFVDKH